MAGFSEDIGAMLYLHDQQEIPFVKDQGVMLPTGMHSMIAVRHTQVRETSVLRYSCQTYSVERN